MKVKNSAFNVENYCKIILEDNLDINSSTSFNNHP